MTLILREANAKDSTAIQRMVDDFVRGHPAENHPRSVQTLHEPHLRHVLGMFGAEAAWLYVKPEFRRSGIVAALVKSITYYGDGE